MSCRSSNTHVTCLVMQNFWSSRYFLSNNFARGGDTHVTCFVIGVLLVCDGKLTKIPKRDFIFARVKTGQVGT